MEAGNYTFSDFSVNANTRQLFSGREISDISSKGFDILLYLIKNRGKVVSKDEIFDAIWGETFVEENTLPVHISALRRTLGEKRGESQFIKTVSGKGYIFIAPVEEKIKPADTSIENKAAVSTPNNSLPTSIAVLPFIFENENDDLEYLANGVTQSLIESLSQISDLKVMAFTAVKNYRGSNLDLTEIGFQLSADKILHGTLTEYKNMLDISVELINVSDKSHLWGTNYNCKLTDVFAVRKEISINIAGKLKLRIGQINRSNLAKPATNSTEAYELFLKGKYILDNFQSSENYRESFESALNFFQQSIKKDPHFAPSYVGSGRVYYLLFNDNFIRADEAFDKIQNALHFALNIDPHFSDAYILQALSELHSKRNWQATMKSLEQAIELNPNNSYAYHLSGFVMGCQGKFEESLRYQNLALKFDPASLLYNSGLINRFYLAKDFRQAIVQAEEALEINPRSVPAWSLMALSYCELKMFDEAIKNSEKAIAVQPLNELILMQGYIYAAAGKTAESEKLLSRVLSEKNAARQFDFADAAAVFSASNDHDKTFEFLEKALTEGSPNILFLKPDPRFQNSRNDVRFASMLKKLNLD